MRCALSLLASTIGPVAASMLEHTNTASVLAMAQEHYDAVAAIDGMRAHTAATLLSWGLNSDSATHDVLASGYPNTKFKFRVAKANLIARLPKLLHA